MPPYLNRILCALLLAIAATAWAAPVHDRYGAARQRFLDARSALQAGQLSRFRHLEAGLRDYPLYPYLRYYALRRDLAHAGTGEITAFLHDYADIPITPLLRSSWLFQLARQRRWGEFRRFYTPQDSVELRCDELHARLLAGERAVVLKRARDLWLVGHSQPSACDPVFKVFEASSAMTTELIWARIRLAMDAGNLNLAEYLATTLGPADRRWVALWARTYRRPATMLDGPDLRRDVPIVRDIVALGLRRLARADAAGAYQVWDRVRGRYRFEPRQEADLLRDMALAGARQRRPEALGWLAAVPAVGVDAAVRSWRVRAALRAQDWPAVLHWIGALTPAERDQDVWRYWWARALDHTGHRTEGHAALAVLAKERSYHGFLAADILGQPYAMQFQPIPATAAELDRIAARPGLVRARELYLADLRLAARREWQYALTKLSSRDLELAAVLAHRWGWYDRAILTSARAGSSNDLELRFPLPFQDTVTGSARRARVDPAWVLGVMRQESAFMVDARSPAGALGLMQLMPATGRHTARLLQIRPPEPSDLLEAQQNIRLGTAYLRRMLDRFDGNTVLATAAYNAGPQRVAGWLPEAHSLPADLWVDLVPFTETRRYIRGVLAFTEVFDWRLKRPIVPLDKRMPPIDPAAD